MRYSAGVRWLLFFTTAIGLLGKLISGQAVFARIAYVSLSLLLGMFIWSRLSLRGTQIIREARLQRASMGDIFEEHFEISGISWPGCPWLEIINQSTLPMASGSRLLTNLGPRQKRFYSARTVLVERGAFPLGPTVLTSGDPFGLFSVRRAVPSTHTLIVLPMTVDIKTFPPPPGLLPGGRVIRQKTMDVTPHVAGIREYLPGDAMKRIHWPSTAKRGRFMVKEFEQDPQSDIWIFLDAQKEVQARKEVPPPSLDESGLFFRKPKVTLPCDTFEYAVSVAASLARYFLISKRTVGLACASNRLTVIQADRGERQLGKVLETLAFLRPGGMVSLQSLISIQAKLLTLGSGVVLITPSRQPELFVAIEELQRRNLRPIVVLLDSGTFGGQAYDESFAVNIISQNIPVCQLRYGDDLSLQLSLPALYFDRHPFQKAFFSQRTT